jgi:hypothetical protein
MCVGGIARWFVFHIVKPWVTIFFKIAVSAVRQKLTGKEHENDPEQQRAKEEKKNACPLCECKMRPENYDQFRTYAEALEHYETKKAEVENLRLYAEVLKMIIKHKPKDVEKAKKGWFCGLFGGKDKENGKGKVGVRDVRTVVGGLQSAGIGVPVMPAAAQVRGGLPVRPVYTHVDGNVHGRGSVPTRGVNRTNTGARAGHR